MHEDNCTKDLAEFSKVILNKGYNVILTYGRSIWDPQVDDYDYKLFFKQDNKVRQTFEIIRRIALEDGRIIVYYSLSTGLFVDLEGIKNEYQDEINRFLRKAGFINNMTENEFLSIIRNINSLNHLAKNDLPTLNGKQIRLLFFMDFTEHLLDCSAVDKEDKIVKETIKAINYSSKFRSTGHVICFNTTKENFLDEIAGQSIYKYRFSYPNIHQIKTYLETRLTSFPNLSFEENLSFEQVARISSGMENNRLEILFTGSDREKKCIGTKDIYYQKSQQVIDKSEGTLQLMNPDEGIGFELHGTNTLHIVNLLRSNICNYINGEVFIPNIYLIGPTSAGKSCLTKKVFAESKIPALELLSPKGSLVGETERKVRLQFEENAEDYPSLRFADEFDLKYPINRNETFGDSGASRAIIGTIQSALTRFKPKIILVCTGNLFQGNEALKARFTRLGVFSPLREDYPSIILSKIKLLNPEFKVVDQEYFRKICLSLYDNELTIRRIESDLINSSLFIKDKIGIKNLEFCLHSRNISSKEFNTNKYIELMMIPDIAPESYVWYFEKVYTFPDHLAPIFNNNREIVWKNWEEQVKRYEQFKNV